MKKSKGLHSPEARDYRRERVNLPAVDGSYLPWVPPWRVGRKVGRTIYFEDKLVGLMDTPEMAKAVVEAMNDKLGGSK